MRLIPLTALVFFLVACGSSPDLPPPQTLSYLAQQPLRLNIARVEVVKQYQSSSQPPHVENDLPMPPMAMIHQWTQDRLIPVGKTGHAVVTIEEASVVESSQGPRESKGWFASKPGDQYEAKVSVKIEIFDDAGVSKGFAYARSQTSRSMAANLTLGQRRIVWMNMMETVLTHLDKELEFNAKRYLSAYLQ